MDWSVCGTHGGGGRQGVHGVDVMNVIATGSDLPARWASQAQVDGVMSAALRCVADLGGAVRGQEGRTYEGYMRLIKDGSGGKTSQAQIRCGEG